MAEDRQVLGPVPTTIEAFAEMTPNARSASRALLKGFEQYVDTIQRILRTQLRITGYRLKGRTPFDIANLAEELDQVADANGFHALVRLRNELAHEYPEDTALRFARFSQALAGVPFLDDAADRVRRFAATRLPGADQ